MDTAAPTPTNPIAAPAARTAGAPETAGGADAAGGFTAQLRRAVEGPAKDGRTAEAALRPDPHADTTAFPLPDLPLLSALPDAPALGLLSGTGPAAPATDPPPPMGDGAVPPGAGAAAFPDVLAPAPAVAHPAAALPAHPTSATAAQAPLGVPDAPLAPARAAPSPGTAPVGEERAGPLAATEVPPIPARVAPSLAAAPVQGGASGPLAAADAPPDPLRAASSLAATPVQARTAEPVAAADGSPAAPGTAPSLAAAVDGPGAAGDAGTAPVPPTVGEAPARAVVDGRVAAHPAPRRPDGGPAMLRDAVSDAAIASADAAAPARLILIERDTDAIAGARPPTAAATEAPVPSATAAAPSVERPPSLLSAMPSAPDGVAQAAAEAPPAAPPTPRAPPPPPARQVASIAIALALGTGGAPRLTVALEPEELGRVEIRVERGPDGEASTVRVVAERPETLALLQRDARQLDRALQGAGVALADGAMQFSLAGREGGRHAGDGAGTAGGHARRDLGSPDAALQPAPPPRAAGLALLDIAI